MLAGNKTALVTGASSGIGAAFAEGFASAGFNLVVTARREARLQAIAAQLRSSHGVRVEVIPCDLTAPGAASVLCAEIERRGLVVTALVNSAGCGAPGVFTTPAWEVHERMLQMMVVALSELTYRLLPGMIERRHGRIVNVASIAGLVPSGAGTLYGAAKTYVVSFSRSLAREVAGHGIHVTAVCPGLTQTEFHATPPLRDTVKGMPRWMWMDAHTVARQGFDAVMNGHTVYVNGSVNRALVAFFRHVPQSLVRAVRRAARPALR
jgi:short-subunit dehydrogenase